jgi:hypothetical protein
MFLIILYNIQYYDITSDKFNCVNICTKQKTVLSVVKLMNMFCSESLFANNCQVLMLLTISYTAFILNNTLISRCIHLPTIPYTNMLYVI